MKRDASVNLMSGSSITVFAAYLVDNSSQVEHGIIDLEEMYDD